MSEKKIPKKVRAALRDAIERCHNQHHKWYYMYGARGITVSECFRKNSLLWYEELGDPPSTDKKWSVDRIDSRKGYHPGNIRWATPLEQTVNQRKSSNNTSNTTGVTFYTNKQGVKTVIAWWSHEGRSKSKSFAVKKFGLIRAHSYAIQERRNAIMFLRTQGIPYSLTHGLSGDTPTRNA